MAHVVLHCSADSDSFQVPDVQFEFSTTAKFVGVATHPQLDGLLHLGRAISSKFMSLIGDDGYLAAPNVMVDLQLFIYGVQKSLKAVAVVNWVDGRVDW